MVCDLAVVSMMLNPQERHTGGNAQLQALPSNASGVARCAMVVARRPRSVAVSKRSSFWSAFHQFPRIPPLEILVAGILGPPFASPLAPPSSDLAFAGVAVHLIPVATTAQRVRGQGF